MIRSELNPDVQPFIPRVLPMNLRNGNKSETTRKKNNKPSNVTNLAVGQKELIPVRSETTITTLPALNDTDFPSMSGCQPDSYNDKLPHKHGLRAYNVVASTATPKVKEPFKCVLSDIQAIGSEQDDFKTKKKKSKKKVAQPVIQLPRKAPPLTLDSFIATTDSKTSLKKSSKNLLKQRKVVQSLICNPLDTTAPKRRHGKEREVPKVKKPTYFKKIIIKDKERRLIHLQASKALKLKRNASTKYEDSREKLETAFETLDLTGENTQDTILNDLKALSLAETVATPNNDIFFVAKRLLHCAANRDYCDHCLTDEIDQLATNLITELVRFQDRMHFKDPTKARIRMRYCCGLKEVSKYISLKKIKCLIIAPDIQQIVVDGVLDRTVQDLVKTATKYETQIVFALNRQQLAYLSKKRGRVSCIGVMNADGVLETLKELLEVTSAERESYQKALHEVSETLQVMNSDDYVAMVNKLPGCVPGFMVSYRSLVRRQTKFWLKNKKQFEPNVQKNDKIKQEL